MFFNKNTTRGRILTQILCQHIQTKMPAWFSSSSSSRWKCLNAISAAVLTCHHSKPEKLLMLEKLTDLWEGIFPPFLQMNSLDNIRIPFAIQGCNKTPMHTYFPICTSWVWLPNKNSHSEHIRKFAFPPLSFHFQPGHWIKTEKSVVW